MLCKLKNIMRIYSSTHFKIFGFLLVIPFFVFGLFGCDQQVINKKSNYRLVLIEEKCGINKKIIKIEKNNESKQFCVEFALDDKSRARGLMYRNALPEKEGMLFVFEDESIQSFWMKNTLIPLDMLFFDKDGNLVDYKGNVQPCKTEACESYVSSGKAKYVLEINPGILP